MGKCWERGYSRWIGMGRGWLLEEKMGRLGCGMLEENKGLDWCLGGNASLGFDSIILVGACHSCRSISISIAP